jgi:hypothetical protein
MKRWLTILTTALVLLMASAAAANPILLPGYGWEDGGTVLGMSGTGDPPLIATAVTAPDPVHWENASLRLVDNSPSGTPQAYIAFIWNLQEGDYVMAGFWRYDDSPGAAPSCRIWGHWNNSLPWNPEGYDGSAGGNDDYGNGQGWGYTSWEWIVPAGQVGLVVEVRVYSNPGDTVWVDDVEVLAPEHALIQFPGDGPVDVENRAWGEVKSLFR